MQQQCLIISWNIWMTLRVISIIKIYTVHRIRKLQFLYLRRVVNYIIHFHIFNETLENTFFFFSER